MYITTKQRVTHIELYIKLFFIINTILTL